MSARDDEALNAALRLKLTVKQHIVAIPDHDIESVARGALRQLSRLPPFGEGFREGFAKAFDVLGGKPSKSLPLGDEDRDAAH